MAKAMSAQELQDQIKMIEQKIQEAQKTGKLHLTRTNLTSEGANVIAAAIQSGACTNLTELNLGRNNLTIEGGNAIAAALQSGKCPNLTQLNLEHNNFTYWGAQAIAAALQSGRYPNLTQLNLTNINLTAEGAKVLASAFQSGKCHNLMELDLTNTNLTDEGAKVIAAALQLRGCPNLTKLSIRDNDITAEGAKALALALQSGGCPNLAELYLENNSITDEGARAILAATIQSGAWPNLMQLQFGWNDITQALEQEIEALLKAWSQKVTAQKAQEEIQKAILAQKAEEQKALLLQKQTEAADSGSLNLANESNPEVIKHFISVIASKSLSNLTSLNLEGSNLGLKALKPLFAALKAKACPNLTTLNLEGNALGTDGAAALLQLIRSGALPKLTELEIAANNITLEDQDRINIAIERQVEKMQQPQQAEAAAANQPAQDDSWKWSEVDIKGGKQSPVFVSPIDKAIPKGEGNHIVIDEDYMSFLSKKTLSLPQISPDAELVVAVNSHEGGEAHPTVVELLADSNPAPEYS